MLFSWIRNQFDSMSRTRRAGGRLTQRKLTAALRPIFEAVEERTLMSFTAPVSYAGGTTPSAVEIRDFNGDGINDVAALNSSPAPVSVMLGNGDGTFQSPVTSPAGGAGTTMAVADFNHDGNVDIVP